MDKEKSDEKKAKKKLLMGYKKNYIAYFCIFSKWKDVFPSINFYPSGFDHLTFTLIKATSLNVFKVCDSSS